MGITFSQLSSRMQSVQVQTKLRGMVTYDLDENVRVKQSDMPAADEVEHQFATHLKECVLRGDDVLYLESQPIGNIIKWNLVLQADKLKHPINRLTSDSSLAKLQSDSAIEEELDTEHFLKVFKVKCLLSDLVVLYDWLDQDANEEEIKKFMKKGVMVSLHKHLDKALSDVEQTGDFNKQILILRTFTKLFEEGLKHQDADKFQSMMNTVFLNFSETQVEVTSLVLDIAIQFCWCSDKAQEVVMKAMQHLQQKKQYCYTFEPFIKVLEDSKNVMMLVQITSFLNTIIEAPSSNVKRIDLKEDLLQHGVTMAMGDVRIRIRDKGYQLKNCTYETVMLESSTSSDDLMDNIIPACEGSKTLYLTMGQGVLFKEQVEVLASEMDAFDELLKELEEDDSDSQRSSDSGSQEEEESDSDAPQSPGRDVVDALPPSLVVMAKPQARQSILNMPLMGIQGGNQVGGARMSVVNFQLTQQSAIPKSLVEDITHMTSLMKEHAHGSEQVLDAMKAFSVKMRNEGVTLLTKFLTAQFTLIGNLMSNKRGGAPTPTVNRAPNEFQMQDMLDKDQQLQVEISQLHAKQKEQLKELYVKDKAMTAKHNDNIAMACKLETLTQENQLLKRTKFEFERQILDGIDKEKGSATLGQEYLRLRLQFNRVREELDKANIIIQKQSRLNGVFQVMQGQRKEIDNLRDLLITQKVHNNQTQSEQEMSDASVRTQTKIVFLEQTLRKNAQEIHFQKSVNKELKHSFEAKIRALEAQIKNVEPTLDVMAPPPPPPPPPPPVFIPVPPPLPVDEPDPSAKKRVRPKCKVKQVMWNALAKNALPNTIWSHIDDSLIELDYKYLEEQFAARAPIVLAASQSPVKAQKVSMLNANRSRNVELILSRLKISNIAIVDNLMSCNSQVLHPNIVESLLNCLPQESEVALFTQAPKDFSKLAVPDLFFLEIIKVNEFEARLKSMQFETTFQETSFELKKKVNQFDALCVQVLQDTTTKLLFTYILAVGNFLNTNPNKKDAMGIQLDSLERMADITSCDTKETVLMYAIKKAELDTEKQLVDTKQNFEDIAQWSKISIQQLFTELREMQHGLEYLEKAIKSQTSDEGDKVEVRLSTLAQEVTQRIDELENELKTSQDKYGELCTYFGENASTLNSDAFFAKILKYKTLCKNAKMQNVRLENLKEKEVEKKKLLELQLQKQRQPQNSNRTSVRQSVVNDQTFGAHKKQDKAQILETLKERRSSKTVNNIKTVSSSLQSLMEMQKKLKSQALAKAAAVAS